jgi:predicted dehydrogenase
VDENVRPGDTRVALIGFGYAGRVFHAPLISGTPGLLLSVVGSSQREKVRLAYPRVEVLSDALSAVRHRDVDLVVIATPNETHASLADAALRAGKHVVVDKPFTVTLAEARALAVAAAESGRVLSVFQNRRWDSDFLGLTDALATASIGDIVELRSEISRYRPQVRDRWREQDVPGGGLWYDLGPHLIDQALVLFGPPQTIQADLQIQRGGASAVDWFLAVLGYTRTRVILASSMLATDPATRFRARGTKGSLIKRGSDQQERQLLRGQKPGSAGWGKDPDPVIYIAADGTPPAQLAAPPGNYLRYYEAIRDAIRGKGAPPVTPAEATTVMAVIEAGIKSSRESRVVSPEYTGAERSAWNPIAAAR